MQNLTDAEQRRVNRMRQRMLERERTEQRSSQRQLPLSTSTWIQLKNKWEEELKVAFPVLRVCRQMLHSLAEVIHQELAGDQSYLELDLPMPEASLDTLFSDFFMRPSYALFADRMRKAPQEIVEITPVGIAMCWSHANALPHFELLFAKEWIAEQDLLCVGAMQTQFELFCPKEGIAEQDGS